MNIKVSYDGAEFLIDADHLSFEFPMPERGDLDMPLSEGIFKIEGRLLMAKAVKKKPPKKKKKTRRYK